MTRAYYDTKPPKLEAVGNGNYLYRWDIQEEVIDIMVEGETAPFDTRVQYSCREVTIHGKPEYGKCVEAVIRSDYSAEAELALVNKYNAYQQGLDVEADIVNEYTKYLSLVANAKRQVRKDLGEETSGMPQTVALTPRIADIAKLLTLTVNTMSLTDSDALSVKSVYPNWGTLIGKEVKKDEKMQCDGKLWKVQKDHTVQEQYRPGTGTESLYTEISETHIGSIDDPIPYNNNMELEEGKYYSQDGCTYRCTRSTEVPVYADLKDIVGIYVKTV